jgi:hypothetical protein
MAEGVDPEQITLEKPRRLPPILEAMAIQEKARNHQLS